MDLLKRSIAPVLPAAWDKIDEEARRVLQLHLAGRKLVDVDGPHGLELSAVSLGRMEGVEAPGTKEVSAGRRVVLPLVEVRAPIRMSGPELDAVARGGEPDLEPVAAAARAVAAVEDRAVLDGWAAAGITGIAAASAYEPVAMPDDPSDIAAVVVEAIQALRRAGVGGPYALALGPRPYGALGSAAEDGYPVRERIERIVEGPIVWAPTLEGGIVASRRGGDFELVVGQDLAIGYTGSSGPDIDLFLTESFTFRVREPAAAVVLGSQG